jgi:hypothetical protein
MSRHRPISTVTDYRLDDRGSISVVDRDFCLRFHVPGPYPIDTGGSFPGGKSAEAGS